MTDPTLKVIAPSGRLRNLEPVQLALDIWRSRGYAIAPTPDLEANWGYLAGKDGDRRSQLIDAIQDENICGILCVRGGYGATRLLEGLPKCEIPASPNPKFLIGFSDITALLWGLSEQENILGIHGPVLTTLSQEPDWAIARLFDCVENRQLEPLQGKGWGGGRVRGRLFPGNLTVAICLLGTAYQPDFTGTILAFEDTNEEPYRIDRMLTHWRMAGAFEGVRGIALGRFSNTESEGDRSDFSVEEVLRDRLGDLGIPIISDLPFGHDGCNAVLPVGVEVELDGDAGTLNSVLKYSTLRGNETQMEKIPPNPPWKGGNQKVPLFKGDLGGSKCTS